MAQTTQNQAQQIDQLVAGSAWLTIGQTISRVLGAIYIIPWTILLGQHYLVANGLFNKGYTIYALFLMIATAGIPAAISDLVARYFAANQGSIAKKIFNNAIKMGIILGVVMSAILFFGSGVLAAGDKNLPKVLASLAPAVLLFPVISIIRGYFQGLHDMKTSAISQVIEQIVRIAYMLISAFVVLQHSKNDWVGVTIQSTFAAFIGAVVSFVYLVYVYRQYTQNLRSSEVINLDSNVNSQSSTNRMIMTIIRKSLPFIAIGSAITIFQLIDQYTYPFLEKLAGITSYEIDLSFARFNANANKLIMIIVPFATAIAATALPLLAESTVQSSRAQTGEQLTRILKLFSLIMLPSAFGMYAIASSLYAVFYGVDDKGQSQGIALLQVSSMMAIFFGLFMVLTTSLQALEKTKVAFRSFIAAIIIKIILQIPLVLILHAFGDLYATMLAFSFANWVMLDFVGRHYRASFSNFLPELRSILITSILVLASAFMASWLLDHLVSYNRIGQAITMIGSTGVGVVVGVFCLKIFSLGSILGSRLPSFLR